MVRHHPPPDDRPDEGGAGGVNSKAQRLVAERAMDHVLADSFPASDPPSWTSGIARPEPVRYAMDAAASGMVLDGDSRADILSHGAIPGPNGRTFLQGLASLVGAAGIALLVPFAILLVGLPVALAVRGALEAMRWLIR